MKNLKKNLKSLKKDLNAITKKVDKMIAAVGKVEKPKVTKKAKPKLVKPKPKKKIVAKKSVAKKVTKTTDADTVFNIIKRYKKGVGTAALMKNIGFDQKKVFNIVYKLKKQGKIKSAGKGVYVKA
ncbi:hypothetical protein ACFL7E_09065 [Thermodesulfobacteriota bacterium]